MTKTTTLFIIFGNLGIGGVQKKVTDITKFIASKKAENVHIHIILRDKHTFEILSLLTTKNTSIHYRPEKKIFGAHIPFSLYIAWKTVQLRPNIILTFYDTLSVFAISISRILFWRDIRVVLNEDILTSLHVYSKFKRILIEYFYPLADRIIVPTTAIQNDLIQKYHIKKKIISIVPNWTLLRYKRDSRHKIYDIIYIGRFEKQKNIIYLLSCMKTLIHRDPSFQGCLVGEGSEIEHIISYLKTHSLQNNIHIFSSTIDVEKYLYKSRIFALSSTYEGMSVATLEAMATGTPVVVTNHPGIDEYVFHNKTGLLVNNKSEFVKSTELLLSDARLRTRLKINGLNVIHEHFSDSAIQCYINELLGNQYTYEH